MKSKITLNVNRLHIFHEVRKRRIFVGELVHIKDKNQYELIYDESYVNLKNAIPISPKMDLFKKRHVSKKGELFAIFQDRIPSRENPAYEDYCYAQGISPDEKNAIILLGSIGKRGPSSFIFEPVYDNNFSVTDIKAFRKILGLSQNDLALAFDIKKVTLQLIESGKSTSPNIMKLIQIYFEFPKVTLWQLEQTGSHLHSHVLLKLKVFFQEATS